MTRPSPKLIKLWNKKLAASGFVDIEDQNSPNEYLKQWSTYFKNKNTPEQFQAKQHYYLKAQQFLQSHPFANKVEFKIWECHANATLNVRESSKKYKIPYAKAKEIILRLQVLCFGHAIGLMT